MQAFEFVPLHGKSPTGRRCPSTECDREGCCCCLEEQATKPNKYRMSTSWTALLHCFCSIIMLGWIYIHLWRAVERVWVEDGLYHYQRLCQILTHKMMSVVGRLVRTVIEHLQERGSPQVEHELSRENRQLLISEMWHSPNRVFKKSLKYALLQQSLPYFINSKQSLGITASNWLQTHFDFEHAMLTFI